ncbi:hypothetical protein G0Q06_02195 [Puniceicoccales bacterium CK1056]|uniref:Uncharacterized protein n=1 Tax=Oceanipulchritudo coccoides TaxID=2706888 RepID=A0A6B2LZQ6_9BACT|nr:hypothetical protein [Oceanipulchritudo coccoides]NDV61257.1 hypothetical protein [Oceanipulchritudo coccoides]
MKPTLDTTEVQNILSLKAAAERLHDKERERIALNKKEPELEPIFKEAADYSPEKFAWEKWKRDFELSSEQIQREREALRFETGRIALGIIEKLSNRARDIREQELAQAEGGAIAKFNEAFGATLTDAGNFISRFVPEVRAIREFWTGQNPPTLSFVFERKGSVQALRQGTGTGEILAWAKRALEFAEMLDERAQRVGATV